MENKKKMTISDFKKFKQEGKKFSYVTAYDYTMASIVNDSEVEIILVGDSLGMIMLGYKGTESVTMDDMVPVSYTHLRAHETRHDLVCRLLLEKKKKKQRYN